MKKNFAFLLAFLMIFSAVSAMAQTADEKIELPQATPDFDITVTLPEGYQMQEDYQNDAIYLLITPESEKGTSFDISLSHSEAYEGQTLNEMSESDKKELLDWMDEDFAQPEVHSLVTESGTEVYLFNESAPDADSSYAEGFTVYKGYFVTIYVVRDDEEHLQQADLDLAMKILSDLWFVEK